MRIELQLKNSAIASLRTKTDPAQRQEAQKQIELAKARLEELSVRSFQTLTQHRSASERLRIAEAMQRGQAHVGDLECVFKEESSPAKLRSLKKYSSNGELSGAVGMSMVVGGSVKPSPRGSSLVALEDSTTGGGGRSPFTPTAPTATEDGAALQDTSSAEADREIARLQSLLSESDSRLTLAAESHNELRLQALEIELKGLNSLLSTRDKELAASQTTIQTLESKLQQLQKQLRTYERESVNSQEKMQVLSQLLVKAQRNAEESKLKVTMLEELSHKEGWATTEILEEIRKSAEGVGRVQALEERIAQLEEENERLKKLKQNTPEEDPAAPSTATSHPTNSIEPETAHLEEQITALQAEISTLRSTNHTLELEVSTLKHQPPPQKDDSLTLLMSQVENMTASLTSAKRQKEDLDKRVMGLMGSKVVLEKENRKLQALVGEKEEVVKVLEGRVGELEGREEGLKEEVRLEVERRKVVEEEKRMFEGLVKELEREKSMLEDVVKSVEEENEKLKGELEEARLE
ncbi:hypothetical protein HDV05_008817, partial [Chytridiales sp. JEL 0842]